MTDFINMLGMLIGTLGIGGLFFIIIYAVGCDNGVDEAHEEAVKKGFGEWVIEDKEIVFKWKESK